MNDDDDDEDWVELERDEPLSKPEASVMIVSLLAGRARTPCFLGRISLRGEIIRTLQARGITRFKVQIGGAAANKIKLIPLSEGRFELGFYKGGKVGRISLGNVSAWPDERREATKAVPTWGNDGALVLTLPTAWAVGQKAERATRPQPKEVDPSLASKIPIRTSVGSQLADAARVMRQRTESK